LIFLALGQLLKAQVAVTVSMPVRSRTSGVTRRAGIVDPNLAAKYCSLGWQFAQQQRDIIL